MKKIKDGDSNPIISIIIPFYNTPLYKLDRCLKSILCNTKVKFEIILVDDGSHYKNFIEIYRLTKNHSEIHLIRHKKNQGLYSARITALKQIKGKYFGFVDSDDYIGKEMYSSMLKKTCSALAIISLLACATAQPWNSSSIGISLKESPIA